MKTRELPRMEKLLEDGINADRPWTTGYGR